MLAFPVREVRGLEPSVEVAPHACLELRVDQSCRYGGDRENRITVSCMGGMKRTGLGTQRGRKLRKSELKPSVREGSSRLSRAALGVSESQTASLGGAMHNKSLELSPKVRL